MYDQRFRLVCYGKEILVSTSLKQQNLQISLLDKISRHRGAKPFKQYSVVMQPKIKLPTLPFLHHEIFGCVLHLSYWGRQVSMLLVLAY